MRRGLAQLVKIVQDGVKHSGMLGEKLEKSDLSKSNSFGAGKAIGKGFGAKLLPRYGLLGIPPELVFWAE